MKVAPAAMATASGSGAAARGPPRGSPRQRPRPTGTATSPPRRDAAGRTSAHHVDDDNGGLRGDAESGPEVTVIAGVRAVGGATNCQLHVPVRGSRMTRCQGGNGAQEFR